MCNFLKPNWKDVFMLAFIICSTLAMGFFTGVNITTNNNYIKV